MMTRVLPCRLTNHRRSPTGDPVANSRSIRSRSARRPHCLERPGDGPVNPGVGIVGIEIEQARYRPLASDPAELLLAEFTQGEDQGPADRDIILHVQLSQHPVRICAQGAEPMDEITPGPRVGTMLEDRPHLALAIEPRERHGRVGLAPRESVLGLFGDHRPVPDRGRHRQAAIRARRRGDRDRAITVRGQLGPEEALLGDGQPVQHLRLELRADVPESGRQQDGVSLAVSLELDRAQLHVGQHQARAVVLAKVGGRAMEEPGRGPLLIVPPGPQARTVRLPLVVEDHAGSLTVEFLLDQGRRRCLFPLPEPPDDQADFRIRDIGFLPDGRVPRR